MSNYNENNIQLSLYLSKNDYEDITYEAKKQNRSRVKQVLHWIKLGQLLERHPEVMTMLNLRDQLR